MAVMSSSSEHLSPHVGADNGASIRRSASRDTLSAHPLLSPSPTPSAVSLEPSVNIATSPKYLPYTPRQRVPLGSVTTGTTVHSAASVSPQQLQHGIATSKLQLQNLKAAAQSIGLDVGSIGWLMLETLVAGVDHGPAMTEIWNLITVGKATLLLPLEQATAHDSITPELMRDHVMFSNGGARDDVPTISLSGLRGTIVGEDLIFRSVLSPASKTFNELRAPSTRPSTLLALPPLPNTEHLSDLYPKYTLPSFSETLPLPPRAHLPPKPPLPPRPGSRPSSSQGPTSRLSNPFASLFSKSPPAAHPPSQGTSDVPSIDHIVDVAAFTIDRPIISKETGRSLNKAIKADIKSYLVGIPSWVVDRVQSFAAKLLPFPKPSKRSRDSDAVGIPNSPHLSLAVEEPSEDLARSFQAFYELLEDELRAEGSPSVLRKRDERHTDSDNEKRDNGARIRAVMEAVERCLCSIFYDRLFRQSTADDASHDEALASRIAALNMLDLGLEHLGVDAGFVGADVGRIVDACGQTISQVDAAHCPSEKAAILVAAHKIIVDGLSRLPAIHIKSDPTVDEQATPKPVSNEKLDTAKDVNAPQAKKHDTVVEALVVSSPSSTHEMEDTESQPALGSSPDTELSASTVVEVLSESPKSELLTISPAASPTPVSGDILLPLIIFSVVKANPPQLVSHLLYTQRYRNRNVGGEESYCLINLMAVVEFLENVDLGALGLKESDKKVMSTADLTPIPISIPTPENGTSPFASGTAGLRGRVEQQVDAITGSANKVISGVVDSFGVLRAFLPANTDPAAAVEGATNEPMSGSSARPGFGLLRRESVFSIASLAASLPGAGGRDRRHSTVILSDEDGQELVESRPGSIRSVVMDGDDSSSESEERPVQDSDVDEDENEEVEEEGAYDTRSIRSFESMMGRRSRHKQDRKDGRPSLTDRLASMSRLTRPHTRETSHISSSGASALAPLSASVPNRFDTPISSRASSPAPTSSPVPRDPKKRLAPPNRRFLECSPDDLRVSEIRDLLQDYRRLVEGMRAMGGFDETTLDTPSSSPLS